MAARAPLPRSSTEPGPPEPLAAFIARVAPKHTPVPWHLARLVALFDRAQREPVRAIVSMPPRHGKTITVQRALAHTIKSYPERLNGIVMYADKGAQGQSRKIRKLVRAEGVELEPDAQSMNLWLTTAGGGLAATGINGQLTGKGFDGLLILDDPIKGREAAESLLLREKVWETFTDDVFTRLEPPCGSCIVVATRWHEDDLPGRILDASGRDGFPSWEVIDLPAIRDPETLQPSDEGLALWPERYPLSALESIRATLGPYGWWSLYQQRPRPKGGRVFGAEPARYQSADIKGARIVLSVDAAGTDSTSADFTAAVAIAVRGSGDSMTADVLDLLHVQKDPQQVAPLLRAFQVKWGGGAIAIEATRDGKALAKALKLLAPGLDVREVTPVGDKYTRAQPMAAAYNAGRVRLPMEAAWLFDLMHEFSLFTGIRDKRDDIVDAVAQGWNHAASAPVAPKSRATFQHSSGTAGW